MAAQAHRDSQVSVTPGVHLLCAWKLPDSATSLQIFLGKVSCSRRWTGPGLGPARWPEEEEP